MTESGMLKGASSRRGGGSSACFTKVLVSEKMAAGLMTVIVISSEDRVPHCRR